MSNYRHSGYDRKENDAYYTPKGFVDVLCMFYDPDWRVVYDPACGGRDILNAIRQNYPDSKVSGDDIIFDKDFLDAVNLPSEYDIVTNPPYGRSICEKFVRHAIDLAAPHATVAMLLRNDWDCSSRRRDLFGVDGPAYMKIVVNKRFPWIGDTSNGGMHNHAWFLFCKDWIGKEPLTKYGPY